MPASSKRQFHSKYDDSDDDNQSDASSEAMSEEEDELLERHLDTLYRGSASAAGASSDDSDDEDNMDEDKDDEEDGEKSLSFEERLMLAKVQEKEQPRRKQSSTKDASSAATSRKTVKKIRKEKSSAGSDDDSDDDDKHEIKKRNKNAPKEVSSKIKPKKVRNVIPPYMQKKKLQTRDPRFDPSDEHDYRKTGSSGYIRAAKKSYYNHDYEHVHEMYREELKRLRAALRGENASKWTWEQKYEIYKYISVLNGMVAKQKREKDREQIKKEFYYTEKEKVASGTKKPFYLSDKHLDRMVKYKHYEELKKSGTGVLQKKIEKMRKRNKSAQSALMPLSRRNGGGE